MKEENCKTCGGTKKILTRGKRECVSNVPCSDCNKPADDGSIDIKTLGKMDKACGDNLSHGESTENLYPNCQ